MAKQEDILTFWFGALDKEGLPDDTHQQRWFKKNAAFDQEIRGRFGRAVQRAMRGELDAWTQTARGTLALVILLDQFSRNIHRDQPAAFAGDGRALACSRRALETGQDRELRPIERIFLLMPFMHAEDRAVQEEGVRLFEEAESSAPEALRDSFAGFAHYARMHADVIRRFGRFPHRNAVLGRDSTPDELEFLAQPGSSF